MKVIVLAMLVASALSLGSALAAMTRGPDYSNTMATSLLVRVTLSVGLVLLLVIGSMFGWIEPAGA